MRCPCASLGGDATAAKRRVPPEIVALSDSDGSGSDDVLSSRARPKATATATANRPNLVSLVCQSQSNAPKRSPPTKSQPVTPARQKQQLSMDEFVSDVDAGESAETHRCPICEETFATNPALNCHIDSDHPI